MPSNKDKSFGRAAPPPGTRERVLARQNKGAAAASNFETATDLAEQLEAWGNQKAIDRDLLALACLDLQQLGVAADGMGNKPVTEKSPALTQLIAKTDPLIASKISAFAYKAAPGLWPEALPLTEKAGVSHNVPLSTGKMLKEEHDKAAGGRYIPPSRVGKRALAGYFTDEVLAELKMLAAIQQCTTQSLLDEALSDLFQKHEPALSVVRQAALHRRQP